jgi:hypothetical protein
MKHHKTPRLALTAALAAGALAVPATADAAKYVGKASGEKITFKQKGKRISRIKTAILVSCFSSPGSDHDQGIELFNPPGKFKLGKEARKHASRHSAVRGGKKGFDFTVKPKRKSRKVIAGNLRLSYSDSTYDPFTNQITAWYCSGSTKFRARRK